MRRYYDVTISGFLVLWGSSVVASIFIQFYRNFSQSCKFQRHVGYCTWGWALNIDCFRYDVICPPSFVKISQNKTKCVCRKTLCLLSTNQVLNLACNKPLPVKPPFCLFYQQLSKYQMNKSILCWFLRVRTSYCLATFFLSKLISRQKKLYYRIYNERISSFCFRDLFVLFHFHYQT